MLKAVLFDLDNTLYSYTHANNKGLYKSLKKFCACTNTAYKKAAAAHDRIRLELKEDLDNAPACHNRVLFYKRMFEEVKKVVDYKQVLKVYRTYWRFFYKNIKPACGLLKVMSRLRELGLKTAVVSNYVSSHQLKKLSLLKLASFFDAVVISEEVGLEKPAPGIFAYTLDKLALKPQAAVMVGDNYRADIKGAAACTIKTVLTAEFSEQPPEKQSADYHIKRLDELPGLLQRENFC
ncbi:MAG TPA: HAD family hydrolase [Spirochaetota bacterium]|nr:HAD family hydrolase [Spirochaetota bacterium]